VPFSLTQNRRYGVFDASLLSSLRLSMPLARDVIASFFAFSGSLLRYVD